MPTIVTVYVPAGVVTVDWMLRTAAPFEPTTRTMLLTLNELVSPAPVGDTVAESDTLPLKPKLFNVTVIVVEPPATKPAGAGAPTLSPKSGLTTTVKVTECTREAPPPVTVIV